MLEFSILAFLIILLVVFVVLVWPVRLAAQLVDARRTGWGWSALALFVATLFEMFGFSVPILGNIVAFLLSALGFALILDTTFLRGIGIALLHAIFSFLIVFALSVLGLISGGALLAWL